LSPEIALSEIQTRLLGDKQPLLTEGQKNSVLFVLRQFYRISRNDLLKKNEELQGDLDAINSQC
jgi:hypothetical protein